MAYCVAVRYSARRRIQQIESEEVPWTTRLPADFAFLVSQETGRPVQPTFDFLQSKYIKGRRRPRLVCAGRTVEAVVRDLSDFHDFLDSQTKRVEDVDEALLEDYLLSMTETAAPTTARPYSPATVVRRKSSICAFLKYCQDQGLLKHRFVVDAVKTPLGSYEVLGADLPTPSVGPVDRLVRAIDPRVVALLLDATGPAPIDIDENGRVVATAHVVRTRLMTEACYQTGIRREECCNLRKEEIMSADVEGRSPLSTVAIRVVGKGNKERSVPFPVWLLSAMQRYVLRVRDPLVSDAIANGWLKEDHGRLFVLETARRKICGRPVLPAQFGREFKDARDLLVARLAADPDAAVMAERVRRSRLTIHALRHTYALTTFIKRKQQGDADAAKFVQAVLGHAFRDTTERMYLRSSHVYEAELSEAYDLVLRQKVEERMAA